MSTENLKSDVPIVFISPRFRSIFRTNSHGATPFLPPFDYVPETKHPLTPFQTDLDVL